MKLKPESVVSSVEQNKMRKKAFGALFRPRGDESSDDGEEGSARRFRKDTVRVLPLYAPPLERGGRSVPLD